MNTLELNGLTFSVQHERDESHESPWEVCEGHGSVSGWESCAKLPEQRILFQDRNSARFYNVRESLAIATRDKWGLGEKELATLAVRLGRKPTTREITVAAVDADYEFLRAWCNDEWEYVGVIVTLLDVNGDETNESESLWGIESCATDYLAEVAQELAQQIADRVGNADTVPARPSAYVVRNAA